MSTQTAIGNHVESVLIDSDGEHCEVDSAFQRRLERTRQELLETGLRNRLVSTPFGHSRSTRVDVVDEKTDDVFHLLVDERRSMSFLAAKKKPAGKDEPSLFDGAKTTEDVDSDDLRHSDTKLQTPYESTTLQPRLLKLSYDAKLYEEEQGVSILYLATGFLEWYESDSSDAPRYAPLLLIPVDLARTGAADRFKVNYREEDPATNLSLQTKLDKEFGIKLPDVPDLEDLRPSEYFASVSQAIAGQPRWRVQADRITLWFFSFAKFLMYRDLDSANWPEGGALQKNQIVSGLLRDGFACHPPICDETQLVDDVIPAGRSVHVTNADSSQALVIEEVRRGRNIVVQGPPGTGKSETITNVIGALVQEGKKVLFVAEKLAALEVVKSRLDRCGLGPLCLELHSHKANKSSLYADLKRTLELGRPRVTHVDEQCAALDEARQRLNRHSAFMNTPLQPAGMTPFQVLGKLSRLKAKGVRSAPFILESTTSWSRQDFADYSRHLREFEAYVCNLGSLEDHPWKGVTLSVPLLPSDVERLFGSIQALGTAATEIQNLVTRLGALLNVKVPARIGYQIRRNSLMEGDLGTVIDCLERGDASARTLVDQFSLVYFEHLLRGLLERHSELAQFNGQSYEGWISEFRQLDLQRIDTAKKQVALAHFEGVPADSEMCEMAVVRREMEKKRKHKSIRNVLKEAGHAIQAIKPVFMMSPISIAQFLEPGVIQFDVLVMDEASQVTPADALGAMARCKQIVIVGDSKQLPPSRFFSKMLSDGDATSEDDDFSAADMESVLGLCVAQGLPQRMLRWHYRSRHHSLIAVSNHEFYDNRLYVVPSPTTSDVGTGLRFRHIRDGVFDRGKTATNRVEAQAVAQAILEHIQQFPNKSLGVATFSVAQRDAVRDELELLLKSLDKSPDLLHPGGESLFIKNLENVQGDERDVIFISVGYGRDSSGYMSMSFGPLSGEGGERRMNVLISRARERCEVFSSIRADDINTDGAKYRGSLVLTTFLRYAETGVLDTHQSTGLEFDSEFEVQVAEAISQHGYRVDHQIGTAGFRVDLAVADPDCPGRYLMGIECDGATYHSSRSARDRDRSREQVLVDRGWKIHRIWSTDWFHRPEEQLKKVLAALEKVRSNEGESTAVQVPPSAPIDEVVEREQVDVEITPGPGSVAYAEASFSIPVSTPIPDTPLRMRMEILVRVVEIEGPVHRDEVARRMLTLWGQARLGSRIVEAIEQARSAAIGHGMIADDGSGFLTLGGAGENAVVRDRSKVASSTLRKPEFLPPAEVRQSILQIVSREIGIAPDEVSVALTRLLGLASSTASLRERASREMGLLLEQGKIMNCNGRLFIARDSGA